MVFKIEVKIVFQNIYKLIFFIFFKKLFLILKYHNNKKKLKIKLFKSIFSPQKERRLGSHCQLGPLNDPSRGWTFTTKQPPPSYFSSTPLLYKPPNHTTQNLLLLLLSIFFWTLGFNAC